jgi:hypothetical protein
MTEDLHEQLRAFKDLNQNRPSGHRNDLPISLWPLVLTWRPAQLPNNYVLVSMFLAKARKGYVRPLFDVYRHSSDPFTPLCLFYTPVFRGDKLPRLVAGGAALARDLLGDDRFSTRGFPKPRIELL